MLFRSLAWLSWSIGGLEWLGAYCLSTTLLFHGVASVNSVAHLAGEQPFATGDGSRNNPWVAALTFGEGWHNTHHAYPHSARHGWGWREPDLTWLHIQLLQRLGLATAVRLPAALQGMGSSRGVR